MLLGICRSIADVIFICVGIFLSVIVRIFIGRLLVGVYHDLLYLGPSGVCRHKHTKSDSDNKGKDYADRHKDHSNIEVDENGKDYSYSRYKITLEAEEREDKRVFEYMTYFKIKGERENVDIKSHYEIYEYHKYGRPHHKAVEKACGAVVEEYEIVYEKEAY